MCYAKQTALLTRLLAIFTLLHCSFGDIVIINRLNNQTEKVFIDFELSFSTPVSSDGIEGFAIEVDPDDACTFIKAPPYPTNSTVKWFALIKRKKCSLEEKVRNAQFAGFGGAIIYNYATSGHLSENGDLPTNPDIKIPGVLIGEDDGRKMAREYKYPDYLVVMNPDTSFNLSNYLLPFVIVIGVCFLIMLFFLLLKCLNDRRRNNRNRLSSRHLKHLQVKKYKRGDKYDVCAICLEEYCDGEKLRILPCFHAYHTKCIDPWLTNNRRNCPICKRKVAIEGITSESDSDSETENPSERTPLLRSTSNGEEASGSARGTFDSTSPSLHNSGEPNEEAINSNVTEDLIPAPSGQSKFSRFKNSISSTTRAILHATSRSTATSAAAAVNHETNISSSSGSYGSVSSLIAPSSSHSINFEDTVEAAEAAEGERVCAATAIIINESPKTKQRKNELVV